MPIEMVLDGLLVARDDQHHIADARACRLLDDVLHRRPIEHRQHLLRYRLRGRQHPSPKPRRRYDSFLNHLFTTKDTKSTKKNQIAKRSMPSLMTITLKFTRKPSWR